MQGSPKNKFYMAVTNDKFELPIYLTKTAAELSEILGVPRNRLLAAIHYNGAVWVKGERIKIVSVLLEDDDGEVY